MTIEKKPGRKKNVRWTPKEDQLLIEEGMGGKSATRGKKSVKRKNYMNFFVLRMIVTKGLIISQIRKSSPHK